MTAPGFKKYFTLEEAAALLPEVKADLERARLEIAALRDEVILNRRLLETRKQSGMRLTDTHAGLLHEKFETFEMAFARWVGYFAERGIVLRDLDAGLIDFPYHSQKTGQDYFLCWRQPEDGLFYFHGIHEGFVGRHPVTLLPE